MMLRRVMIAGLCTAALGCGKLPLGNVPLGGACVQNEDCGQLMTCVTGVCAFTAPPLCQPDLKRCNGDFVETCSTAGDKYTADANPCLTGCENGACKPAACARGAERKCDGQIILQCNSAGTGFEYFQSCPAGCTQNGQAAECKQYECSPFETKCEAAAPSTLYTCNSRGTAFVESACPTTPESICVAGRCAPKAANCNVTKDATGAITARTQRCNGVVREECNDTETGWNSLEVCEYGCDANTVTLSAACAVPNCRTGAGPNDLAAPFETRCDPDDASRTTLQRCNARGTAWDNIVCSSTAGDAVCDEGRCVPKLCSVTRNASGNITARDEKCDGDMVVQCADSQAAFEPKGTGGPCQFGCTQNAVGNTAECAPAECAFNGGTNPEERCEGDALMRCSSRGTYAFVQFCPSRCDDDTTPGDATCLDPVCPPLSRECAVDAGRNFVELCRADGTGRDRLEECPATCVAGVCVVTSNTCIPGDVRCRGLQTETCIRVASGSTEWRFTDRCLGTCSAGQCDAAGACGCLGGADAALDVCAPEATSTRMPIVLHALTPDEQNLKLPCDGLSRVLVYSDPITGSNGQRVPDGTLVTFAVSTGSFLVSADADANVPGIQRPTLRGRARIVIKAPAIETCNGADFPITVSATVGGSCGGAVSVPFAPKGATDPTLVYVADDFSTSQLQDRANTTAQWDTTRGGIFAIPAYETGDGKDGDFAVGSEGGASPVTATLSETYGRNFGVNSVGPMDVAVDNVLPTLSPGDEVLLTTIWGSAAGASNIVGNYEFKRVAAIATGRVIFTSPVRGVYGSTNTNLTNYRVILQRVPNFRNVTVFANGTLTTAAPIGASGTLIGGSGILAFRATGTVRIAGVVTMGARGIPHGYQQAAATTTALNRLLLGGGGTAGTNQHGGGIVYIQATTLSYRANVSETVVAPTALVAVNSGHSGAQGGTMWIGAGKIELGSAAKPDLHSVHGSSLHGRVRFDYSRIDPDPGQLSANVGPVADASTFFVGQSGSFSIQTTIAYEEPSATGNSIRSAQLFKMIGGSGVTTVDVPQAIVGTDFEVSANDGTGTWGKANDGSQRDFVFSGEPPQGQKFKWRGTLAPPTDDALEILGVGFRVGIQ